MEDRFVRNLKSGSTLLYALLVLAALSAASLALSGSVISSLKQAQAIDMAIRAYYAANAGAEEALYNFRKLDNTVASLNGSATLPNKSSWVRTAQGNEETITTSLKANQSFQLDLYDPENSLTAMASTMRSIKLNWTGPGNEWIEVSYSPWNTDGTVYDVVAKRLFGSSAQPAIINLIGPAYLYKVRIKALYADVSDLTIRAYGSFAALPPEVPIPGRLKIKVTGKASETYQAIEVTMPQKNPASSLYDYVIFSEDPLIK